MRTSCRITSAKGYKIFVTSDKGCDKIAGHHMKLTDKRLCDGHGLNAERYSAHLRLECESVGRGGHSNRDLLNTIWAVGEAMRC